MYRRGAGVYAIGVLSNAIGVLSNAAMCALPPVAAGVRPSVAAGLGYVNPLPSTAGVLVGANIPGDGA